MPETAKPVRRATGVLESVDEDSIVLAIPETSYRLHLKVMKAPNTPIGKRVTGLIHVQARRIDVVGTGGRYVEPVFGRPRRVQGSVVAVDPTDRTITVNAGVPIVCRTDGRQKADQFKTGDFVSMDVHSGATFTPTS
ncbi:MAG: hypothetical protein RIB32_02925 [Phycisphaerales bacterium]